MLSQSLTVHLGLSVLTSLIIILLLFPNITKPFWGHHEFNGAFYSTIARNYHWYGLKETKGAQITTPYQTDNESWSLHTHHPATYPLLLGGWFSLFGIGEMQARLLSIIATVLGWIGLVQLNYQLTKKYLVSWLATLPLLVTPLFLYYAKLPVFEPLLLPPISWGLYFYWKQRHRTYDLITPFFIGLAFLLNWPGFWLGFWLLIYELFTQKRKRFLLISISSLIITGVLIMVHQWLVTGNPLSDFLDVGFTRLAASAQPYTSIDWIKTSVFRAKAFIGIPILFISLLGLVRSTMVSKEIKLFVLSILAMGLSHIFVFRNITWYHDYMLYHLFPFLSVSLIFSFESISKRFSNLVLGLVACFIINLTFGMTHQFYEALIEMRPHKKCVEIGNAIANSRDVMTLDSQTLRENNCGVFIGFYGAKQYTIE